MDLTEFIWSRARSDLTLAGAQGEEDTFLYEHSERVAHSALRIGGLAAARVHAPDLTAVLSAALYHDSFWAVRVRRKEAVRGEVLCRPCSTADREESAEIMRRSLSGRVAPASLSRAAEAISTCDERRVSAIEAKIVADAENLDNIGAFALVLAVRRGLQDGKGVQTLIDQWERRQQYQYWSAMLKDGFHFAEVRAAAEQRLNAYAQFVDQLRREARAGDLSL